MAKLIYSIILTCLVGAQGIWAAAYPAYKETRNWALKPVLSLQLARMLNNATKALEACDGQETLTNFLGLTEDNDPNKAFAYLDLLEKLEILRTALNECCPRLGAGLYERIGTFVPNPEEND